jgi:transmembrane protein
MPTQSLEFLWFPGRVLFVSYFIAMGLSHLFHYQQHAQVLERKGVPLPHVATIATIVTMVAGGALVMVDWYPRVGALLLFLIIFPAPFFLHRFWNETDAYMRLSEFAHLMKDLSLAGAALMLVVVL